MKNEVVQFDIQLIAEICHNVNKAYCESQNDFSQPEWEDAPEWQKSSALNGVKYHLENDVTPEMSHENWLKQKLEEGWVYGKIKDADFKTHPCIMRYDQLPKFQRTKDSLFKAVVDSFKEKEINPQKEMYPQDFDDEGYELIEKRSSK